MIPRYTREEMGRVWSDSNKYSKWLEVELAATETLAEAGQVPGEAAARWSFVCERTVLSFNENAFVMPLRAERLRPAPLPHS